SAPSQTPAPSLARAKPVESPLHSAVVMQPVPKDTATAAIKPANRPSQALVSAPMNIRPAAPPPLPSTVVMQPVPKDPEAGPVKTAVVPAKKAGTHTLAAKAPAPKLALAKAAPAKAMSAKVTPLKSSAPALRTADQGE
ncbi:MAG TPA: hypothetical protein VGF62_05855, partial [Rhizomicrobium sp.]